MMMKMIQMVKWRLSDKIIEMNKKIQQDNANNNHCHEQLLCMIELTLMIDTIILPT